tara:strand:+ start:646 stop:1584 length:939 start_codon:yes stop_codon:yes gene_type:complete
MNEISLNVHEDDEKQAEFEAEADVVLAEANTDDEVLSYKKIVTSIFDKLGITTDHLTTLFNIILGNSLILLFIIIFSDAFGYDLPIDTRPINRWDFQIANLCLLLSYVSSNIIYLRIVIGLACLWFVTWSMTIGSGALVDVAIWNYVMALINFGHAVKLFYDKRPIVFDEYREQIYLNTFDGIMSRKDYKILMKNSLYREIPKNRHYCQINDVCSNLSILVSGKVQILKFNDEGEEITLGTIKENEFIDSPEWIMRTASSRFKVGLLAVTDCTYLMWPREMLIELLGKNKDIETPFMGILGIDVSRKLLNTT